MRLKQTERHRSQKTNSNPSSSRHKKGREIFRYLYCTKLFTPETGNTASGIRELIELNSDMPLSDIKDYVFDGTLDHYFRYAYRIRKILIVVN